VVFAGVYLVGVDPADVPREVIRVAAILRGGDHAMLDGTSALERRGTWDRHDGKIHVVTPFGITSDARHRVQFHRIEVAHIRGSTVDHLPTRGILGALFAAARELDEYQLAHAIWRAEYRTSLTLGQLEAEVHRRARTPGVATVRAAVELRRGNSVGTKSRSEDILRPFVHERFGVPLVNVVGSAGIPGYEPDFCYPHALWIIEVDGGHHADDPRVVQLDAVRDGMLRPAAWHISRVPWRRVHDDLAGVMAELEATARRLRADPFRRLR
jgi:very-short-patch-repair endonuclease